MSRYDVGIFGWWYNINYGANLTYFALNRAIKKEGFSVVMLWRDGYSEANDSLPIRFAKNYYEISWFCPSEKEVTQHNDICNAFILGSDQMWNPDLEMYTGPQFFLSFADEERVKLAYAQSFGNFEELPEWFSGKYRKYLERFDRISVREEAGRDICRDSFGIEADQVCDPVFLIEPQDYDELIREADIDLPEKYILNFILDPAPDKTDACRKIRRKKGYDSCINLTDMEDAEEKCKMFSGDEVICLPSVENFVKAFAKADFIITDSYHGTCLAAIMNKPFLSLANEDRGTKRFESLAEWLDIGDRVFFNPGDAVDADVRPLDFGRINSVIARKREEGLKWIREGLKPSLNVTRQISGMCMGCGACVSICKNNALSLQPDAYGYYKPKLTEGKCIGCRYCSRVCPALDRRKKEGHAAPEAYTFTAKDGDILRQSSAGGIFAVLAREVIKYKGLVAGAAWDEDFTVRHIIVEDEDGIQRLQKAKYLQSYMGDIYRRIKESLESERMVLFSGCPCQVEGLNRYLQKDYLNLFTVDILCSHSPSAKFFKKYLEDEACGDISGYTFNYNAAPEKNTSANVCITAKNGEKSIRHGITEDPWLKAFYSRLMIPAHCEKCIYSTIPRPADITIGDHYETEPENAFFDVQAQSSLVLCNTEKGELLFKMLPEETGVHSRLDISEIGKNGGLTEADNYRSPLRDRFYRYINENTFKDTISEIRFVNRTFSFGDGNVCLPGKYYCEFETEFWRAVQTSDMVVFRTELPVSPRGHFVCFLFSGLLQYGRPYSAYIRFRYLSAAKCIDFTLMNRRSKKRQLIHRFDCTRQDNTGEWIELRFNFTGDDDYYDCISFGAGQISGEGAFICVSDMEVKEEFDGHKSMMAETDTDD